MGVFYVAGVGPASPWLRFQNIMDSRGVPPEGKTAFWDYGRFSDPAVAPLLDKAAASTTENQKKEYLGELDKLFMQQVPAIPLMYRPLVFYEFNTTHWTGFPTDSNPTAPPLFYISDLWHLQPK